VQTDSSIVGGPAPERQEGPEIEALHYLGYTEYGGGILSVVRGLAATNRFRVILGMSEGADGDGSLGFPVLRFPRLEADVASLALLWQTRGIARQAQRWLREHPNGVFHGQSRAGLLSALWLRRRGETRVVASVHTFGRQKWLYRFAARRLADRMFWLSPSMKTHYGTGAADWNNCLVVCLPDCALAPLRRPAPMRLVLGAVGPFAAYKRWDILVDAIALLAPEKRDRIHVIQVGAEESKRSQKDEAKKLRLRLQERNVVDRFTWRGRMIPIAPLWSEIDCLVVASPIEAFSIAALEALAAGVPVLASEVSGTADLVRAVGGFLFSGDSAEGLAAALNRLLEKNAFDAWHRDDAALRRFFASAVSEEYLQVYRRVVASR
jgi:glycosyltransferase involved in cell wall biosynthesis